ncbi:MAG: LysE family translocator [Chloroflexota bacterium]
MNNILGNILLGISLAAPLGPCGVAIIQTGLKFGFLRAFLTGLGITLADTTYLLIVYFGLAGLISIPLVKIAIWSLGALVLLYLGLQSLRESRRAINLDKPGGTSSALSATRSPLLVGYLINISNPIAVVWWLGVFGSLLGATASQQANQLQALLGSSTILVGILAWHTSISLLTHWGKRFVNPTTTRYISFFAGIALILFGLRFGYNAMITVLYR